MRRWNSTTSALVQWPSCSSNGQAVQQQLLESDSGQVKRSVAGNNGMFSGQTCLPQSSQDSYWSAPADFFIYSNSSLVIFLLHPSVLLSFQESSAALWLESLFVICLFPCLLLSHWHLKLLLGSQIPFLCFSFKTMGHMCMCMCVGGVRVGDRKTFFIRCREQSTCKLKKDFF